MSDENSALRLAATDGTVLPWAGYTPRRWQAEALPLALASIKARECGVVSAIMGAGKSRLQAEICASGRGRVLVTVPTVALVDQMADTMAERCPGEIGRYYTHAKEATQRITICCMPSVPSLLADPSWPGPPALWICDEAHRSESLTILSSYSAMAPRSAIAFTATPYRAQETEELSLWHREIYVYGVAQALRDGVIVPFRQVPWRGADGADVDIACAAMIDQVVGLGPGLVNAIDIEDAETFAQYLSAAGIAAEAIHSRLSRPAAMRIVQRLQSGELRAVVHVNMLSEGVDLPWLRWLCMRRPVKSRVRFCQEIGRILRAHPGKTEALLLDPHDLLGRFSLTYEAILSGMAAPRPMFQSELEAAEGRADEREQVAGGMMPPTTLMAAWCHYLRALYLAGMCAGVFECRVKSTNWRPYPASDRQMAAARRAIAGLARDTTVPPRHRAMLRSIAESVEHLRRGDASDLITIGFALRDARREGLDVWARMSAPEGIA